MAAAARPVRKRSARGTKRGGRWTAQAQRRFLDHLAQTAHIGKSAKAAKVSESTVYRKRQESADFRALWEEALREGIAKLEIILLHRALNGVREDQWYGGKKVGSTLRFNDRLAIQLIERRQRTERDDSADAPPEPTRGEMRVELKTRLSEMNRRMGGSG